MHQELTKYTFGAEFEVVFPRGYTFETAANAISAATGITVNVGNRLAPTRANDTAWKIVHDGSVRGNGAQGGEFVAPILKGQEGLDQVAKICAAFVALGFTVNQSCGFHVHVAGFRNELQFFKNLTKLYSRFEPVIDQLMPASRRAANPYCRSFIPTFSETVDSAVSLDSVIFAATGRRASDYSRRFFKLNLAAYAKHSTVEFRQHAGTTDSKKALAWITTCLRIVRAAEAGKTGVSVSQTGAISFAHLPRKTRRVAELVSRPSGATTSEVLEVMASENLPSGRISINWQARRAGLSVRVVRENGRDRFFAEASTTTESSESVTVDLQGFTSLIESDAEEAAFLQQRRAAVALR